MVSGEYNFTYNSTIGYTTVSPKMNQTSFFTKKFYTNRVVAKINNISSNLCSTYGNLITVNGIGFSSNVSDYKCFVAGEICYVQ